MAKTAGAWAAAALAIAASGAHAADTAHGAKVYAAQCAVCHGPSGAGGVGPPLAGVVGRRAGAAPFAYSQALRKTGWTWDAARLDRYLTDPAAAAPGTTMPMALAAPRDRADVIAMLAGWSRTPAPAAPVRR